MTWPEFSGSSLSDYPRWFVLACALVAGVGILWLLAKILKWSLYLVTLFVVLVGASLVLALFFT